MKGTPCGAWMLGVLIACSSLPAVGQSTHPRPFQRAADEYFALLMSRSFDALERAAAEGRKGAALSDGQPRLAALYGGTAGDAIQLTDDLWKLRLQRLEEWKSR